MFGVDLTLIIWFAMGLFIAGLAVIIISRLVRKDNALAVIQKHLKNNQFHRALSLSLKYVDENPNDFMIKYYIAQSYEGLKDYKQAIHYYEKASIAASMTAQVSIKTSINLKIAELYKIIGRYNESLGYYVLLLEKEPNNTKALMSASELLFEMKNFRKAKEYLDTLVKYKQDNLSARMLLARVNISLNIQRDAAAQLEAIVNNTRVDDKVKKAAAASMLADVYLNMKNLPKAVQVLKSLLDNPAFFEDAIIKLIDIYIKTGQLRDAIDFANRNMQKVKRAAQCTILYLIASAYLKSGEVVKAVNAWNSAYKINPNYKDLRDIVDRYGQVIGNPKMEALYSTQDPVFQQFANELLKLPYIKQISKMSNYWAFEGEDKSYVIYKRPSPVPYVELAEMQKQIVEKFRANATIILYSLYGVVDDEDDKDSKTKSLLKKMVLISGNAFVAAVNKV
jgi:tetratricopeptide (TPR) repeat protein